MDISLDFSSFHSLVHSLVHFLSVHRHYSRAITSPTNTHRRKVQRHLQNRHNPDPRCRSHLRHHRPLHPRHLKPRRHLSELHDLCTGVHTLYRQGTFLPDSPTDHSLASCKHFYTRVLDNGGPITLVYLVVSSPQTWGNSEGGGEDGGFAGVA